jgi:hypothetical protein
LLFKPDGCLASAAQGIQPLKNTIALPIAAGCASAARRAS